jgi:hypothetical protein
MKYLDIFLFNYRDENGKKLFKNDWLLVSLALILVFGVIVVYSNVPYADTHIEKIGYSALYVVCLLTAWAFFAYIMYRLFGFDEPEQNSNRSLKGNINIKNIFIDKSRKTNVRNIDKSSHHTDKSKHHTDNSDRRTDRSSHYIDNSDRSTHHTDRSVHNVDNSVHHHTVKTTNTYPQTQTPCAFEKNNAVCPKEEELLNADPVIVNVKAVLEEFLDGFCDEKDKLRFINQIISISERIVSERVVPIKLNYDIKRSDRMQNSRRISHYAFETYSKLDKRANQDVIADFFHDTFKDSITVSKSTFRKNLTKLNDEYLKNLEKEKFENRVAN